MSVLNYSTQIFADSDVVGLQFVFTNSTALFITPVINSIIHRVVQYRPLFHHDKPAVFRGRMIYLIAMGINVVFFPRSFEYASEIEGNAVKILLHKSKRSITPNWDRSLLVDSRAKLVRKD